MSSIYPNSCDLLLRRHGGHGGPALEVKAVDGRDGLRSLTEQMPQARHRGTVGDMSATPSPNDGTQRRFASRSRRSRSNWPRVLTVFSSSGPRSRDVRRPRVVGTEHAQATLVDVAECSADMLGSGHMRGGSGWTAPVRQPGPTPSERTSTPVRPVGSARYRTPDRSNRRSLARAVVAGAPAGNTGRAADTVVTQVTDRTTDRPLRGRPPGSRPENPRDCSRDRGRRRPASMWHGPSAG